MQRRAFLTLTAGAALVPFAAAAKPLAYQPGLVTQRLQAGETVFLDFTASWCGTCASQRRTIQALKDENPAYDAAITFIDIDWDQFRRAEITQQLRIPRRSTLVVLKGEAELGRLVAQTSRSQIKALMDTALTAASA